MAKITLDLNQFKASGVYTIEYDQSQSIVVTTQTVRLVVGFSRTGPINAPVFLQNVSTSRKVFGTIDSFLEKRGSFFHRALETCLQTAPVFGLNLLPLNNIPANQGGDAVDYRAFALAADEDNGSVNQALLSSFYNKERFWFPDESYLQATVDAKPADTGRLFNFVNLGQTIQSVIVVKSQNANQYNVTAQDYFGRGNVPDYMNPLDYLSDYFVDVYVVKGDWTNLTGLAQDPLYSKYFDTRGVIVNQFANFLGLNDVTLTGSFTGAIIPDFIDNNGANQSIDVIINSAVALTGIFCDLNKTKFDDYANSRFMIDMVGNSLINSTRDTIDFLSYNTPIKAILEFSGHGYYAGIWDDGSITNAANASVTVQSYDATVSPQPYVKSYPFGGNRGKFNNILAIPKPTPTDTTFTIAQYNNILATLNTNSLIKANGWYHAENRSAKYANDYLKVEAVVDSGTEIQISVSSPNYTNGYFKAEGPAGDDVIGESTCAVVPTEANTIIVNNFPNVTPAADDILLIEAPGFAKYYEIADRDTNTPYSGVCTIYLKTSLTTGGPYFLDKYAVAGFPADEFASFAQAGDIKVTVFKIGTYDGDGMIPLVNGFNGPDQFAYIANPDFMYSKLVGVGQTYYNTTEDNRINWTNISSGATGFAWLKDGGSPSNVFDGSASKAYDINSTSPTFGGVRITQGGYNQNTFAGGATGDLIKITVPGGQSFYGEVALTQSSISSTQYNLSAPGTGNSVASLAIIEGYPGSKLAQNINANLVVNGDRIKYDAGTSQYVYTGVAKNWSTTKDPYTKVVYGLSGAKLEQYTTSSLTTKADTSYADLNNTYEGTSVFSYPGVLNLLSLYSSQAKNISTPVAIQSPGLYGSGKKFKLDSAASANLNVGDYVVNNDINNPILVRVTSKVKQLDPLTGVAFYEYTVLDTPSVTITDGIYYVTKFTPIQNFADRYQFTKLSGFALTSYHLPNGTDSQIDKIYGVLENTNLATVLEDKNVISFRYIVDTFNGGLQPHMGAKQILSRLAKNRQKCLALLNAPSIAQFTNSTDPRFTELPDAATGNPKPVLNTAYIATGGNLSLGPSYTWSLPDEDQGAKFSGVFSPNIIILENNKNLSIPPAADVSNNFIRKFLTGQPYGIVAGPRRGVISNPKFVKMEYEYLLGDRENLEPAGINPIVTVKNVGPMIYANQTAYQRTLSAFNNIHVRDLLITIEEGIEEILQAYLFEFNDTSTRLEIRQIVNTYLDTVRNNEGIGNYEVIMDDTNNTPALIDQNFGILDVGIEPLRGLQKFINRVTILKTGTISSGGFSAA